MNRRNLKLWLPVFLFAHKTAAFCADCTSITPGAGEIRLDGTVSSVNIQENTFDVMVTSFMLPTGKSTVLRPPRKKTVRTENRTDWITVGKDGEKHFPPLTLAEKSVIIIGPDSGTGRPTIARKVIVLDSLKSPTQPDIVTGIDGEQSMDAWVGKLGDKNIPPDFPGSDIVRLYSELKKKLPSRKDEFETTEHYRKNMEQVAGKGVYAFRIGAERYRNRERDYGLLVAYDADTSLLTIDVKLGPRVVRYDESIDMDPSTRLWGRLKERYCLEVLKKTSYGRGPNRANINGDKRGGTVPEIVISTHELAIINGEVLRISSTPPETVFDSKSIGHYEMHVPPDDAKELMNNIAALFFCTLKPFEDALYGFSEDSDEPRGGIRDRFTFIEHVINTEVLAFWVFNAQTGEVLFKRDSIPR